jgi:hypothetical protein
MRQQKQLTLNMSESGRQTVRCPDFAIDDKMPTLTIQDLRRSAICWRSDSVFQENDSVATLKLVWKFHACQSFIGVHSKNGQGLDVHDNCSCGTINGTQPFFIRTEPSALLGRFGYGSASYRAVTIKLVFKKVALFIVVEHECIRYG